MTGAQPYLDTVEQSTHTLNPSRKRPFGIILLHLHFIFILSTSYRIHFVIEVRVELTLYSLEGCCFIQLSYSTIIHLCGNPPYPPSNCCSSQIVLGYILHLLYYSSSLINFLVKTSATLSFLMSSSCWQFSYSSVFSK